MEKVLTSKPTTTHLLVITDYNENLEKNLKQYKNHERFKRIFPVRWKKIIYFLLSQANDGVSFFAYLVLRMRDLARCSSV